MTRVGKDELHVSVYWSLYWSITRHAGAESLWPDVVDQVMTSVEDTRWPHSDGLIYLRQDTCLALPATQRRHHSAVYVQINNSHI